MLESPFNKVAGLGLLPYLKETPTQVFSYEIFKIFKNTFFTEHLRWLLPSEYIEEKSLSRIFLFQKFSEKNKNTLTRPVNCKKTTRHHAHLSLCAKSRKTNDAKSRKWPKTF